MKDIKHNMIFGEEKLSANCKNPGCVASIQGSLEDWTQEELDNHFDGTCPSFGIYSEEMTQEEKVLDMIDSAKKTIEFNKKKILFWENILKD